MLTYSFTDIGSDSLYVHLYKCVKNDILNGNLIAGTKLPSKRSFSKNLGISNITVENAYALLVSEGYIYSMPKKGYYVSDISVIPTVLENKVKIAKLPVQNHSTYLADFVSNQTIPENFPFSVWAKLIRETISHQSDELMTNPPCGGIMELRLAISNHIKQFRNMDVSPEQIIIGAGTDYLYSLIIQLLGHNKVYAIENPGYKKIANVYHSNHVDYHYVNLDKDGLKISDLENINADIVHISPSHHYPTGIVTPISRRYELLSWASKSSHRFIIEDDYDSEFRLTGKPIPALQSIDAIGKVIYINTFTKSLASTIRISYMILPEPLQQVFYKKLGFYSSTVSNFEQYVLAKFISDGFFEKHINRMRNYYRGVRDVLLKEIQSSPLNSHVTILEEEAGLHFLMKIDTKVKDDIIIKKALQYNIRIACLSQYFSDETTDHPEHVLVMNYSGIKIHNIPEAVKLLTTALLQ